MRWVWILGSLNTLLWGVLPVATVIRMAQFGDGYLLSRIESSTLVFTLMVPSAIGCLAAAMLLRAMMSRAWPPEFVRLHQVGLTGTLVVFLGYFAMVMTAHALP